MGYVTGGCVAGSALAAVDGGFGARLDGEEVVDRLTGIEVEAEEGADYAAFEWGAAFSKRIAPLQAWEAGEVGVVSMNFRLMLHRDSGDMSVCDGIAPPSGQLQVLNQESQVVITWVDMPDVIALKPLLHIASGYCRGHWHSHCIPICHKPDELC